MSQNYSHSRWPTTRRNGLKMYDMNVRFSVGIDEIAAALYYHDIQTKKEAPAKQIAKDLNFTTRKQVWSAVVECYRMRGMPGPGWWDNAEDWQIEAAYAIAEKFFPELERQSAAGAKIGEV